MKSIKLFDVEVIVDGEAFRYDNNQWMNDINIPTEMQTDLLRTLMCFHYIDLTEAYPGHSIIVRLVEPMETDENEIETY